MGAAKIVEARSRAPCASESGALDFAIVSTLREHLDGHLVVWIASVAKCENSLAFLERSLDRSERERAARFKFADDRARFVVGRALIRHCLGLHLALPLEKIELRYTEQGRPVLVGDDAVQFNLSHTNDIVALAVTAGARVGLDIERIQPHPDLLELAARVFSADDFEKFRAIRPHEQLVAFFRAWTRKEAYLKARGEGITDALQQISTSFGPEHTSSIADDRDPTAATTWRLITLPMATEYMASLACDSPNRRMKGRYVHFDKGEIADTTP